jgi:EAL domain-containing protein (putative c-di-GMP-specific phosphodiesterase class I)
MREEEQAMLPPGEFLPILEHYRMLPQLDRWVAQQLVKRLAAGARLPAFTMNLSSQTLEDAQFPEHVAGLARAASLRPGALIFEIEEAELLARTQRVAEIAAALKGAGAGVLIDGYGRKAVSFTPLLKVEPDYVKVEGSIVRKLLKSTVAQTKLDAILRVGSAARMKVIAECVEEPDILEKLKAMGVPYVQGFGIVRPQPIDGLQPE